MSNINTEHVALLADTDQKIAASKATIAHMTAAYHRSRLPNEYRIVTQVHANLNGLSHHQVSLLLAVAVSMLAEQGGGSS